METSSSSPTPSVTFWGAAQVVTGSMHLVEAGGHKVLLDCGAVRGPRGRMACPHSGHFPFDPAQVDAVVLSHAHTDHCGDLPSLVHRGFTGPIYCTAPTRDLLRLMLASSARVHEEDAFVLRVVGKPDAGGIRPFYTRQDVEETVQRCTALAYDQPREIAEGIQVRLVDAGHILGSAMVVLAVPCGSSTATLTFTGDLGRTCSPLLRGPAPIPPADVVVSESTYGGRALESLKTAVESFEEVVRRTVERGGKVLVPTFSLGRTQVIVHCLKQSLEAGRLPPVPVYVDSPLASDITAVYRRYPDYFQKVIHADDPSFLAGETIRYVYSAEESHELSLRRGEAIIIAPGGMCEGGRILQHLKQNIDDPRASIVLVNYQAPHTPGHRLLERGPTVRLHGRKWNKWADVIYLAGFSGHADRNDLLALLGPLAERNPRVRLVHGEPEEAESLAHALASRGFTDVTLPAYGDRAKLC